MDHQCSFRAARIRLPFSAPKEVLEFFNGVDMLGSKVKLEPGSSSLKICDAGPCATIVSFNLNDSQSNEPKSFLRSFLLQLWDGNPTFAGLIGVSCILLRWSDLLNLSREDSNLL